MWIYESPFLLNLLYNTCVDANDLIKYAWREETSTQTDFLQVSDVFCLLHQSELYGQHDNTASSVTGTETNTMNLLADSFLLSFFYIFFIQQLRLSTCRNFWMWKNNAGTFFFQAVSFKGYCRHMVSFVQDTGTSCCSGQRHSRCGGAHTLHWYSFGPSASAW